MLGSRLISGAIKLTTLKTIKDPTSGMRAFNKETIAEFIRNTSLTPEPDTLVYMMKKKYKIREVQVEMKDKRIWRKLFKSNKIYAIYVKYVFLNNIY